MRAEVEQAIMSSLMMGRGQPMPYLVLKINRETMLNDTMQRVGSLTGEELKKPLKVVFIGEEGIDEGGPQAEFFEIMTKQLFDPGYGMFTYDGETRQYWFNADSVEANIQFEMVGVLLGLAIYNR